jgi:acyl carrier protein phosphodiesterase
MNFLAHIYLSGNNDLVKIGNFMADNIHGRKPDSFPPEIQKGILLHRAIDSFTDAHPVFRQGTRRLHPNYHHYAGVIMDIYYDHFLAKNWHHYSDETLEEYSRAFYQSLRENYDVLTDKTKALVPYMIEHNWLTSYATIEGIAHTLTQMDSRTKNKSGMKNSIKELQEYYTIFQEEFMLFFEDVRQFAKIKAATL